MISTQFKDCFFKKTRVLFVLFIIGVLGYGEAFVTFSQTQPTQKHLEKGLELKRAHKLNAALEEFRKAIELDPRNVEAHRYYQDLLKEQGQEETLLAEYHAKVQAEPQNEIYHYLYGRLLNLEDMQRAFQTSLDLNPDFYWGHYGMGYVYSSRNNDSLAIVEYQKAIELDSTKYYAYVNLGNIYRKLGLYQETEKTLSKADRLNPGNAYVLEALALVKADQDSLPQAIQLLERAIQSEPFYKWPYVRLGQWYSDRDEVDKALPYLKKVVAIDPRFATAWDILGRVYYSREEYDKAITAFEKALELEPNLPHDRVLLAWSLYREGRQEQAIQQLERAFELNPEDSHALFSLARMYQETGANQKAIEALEQAIILEPNDIGAYFDLASLYESQDQYQEAAEVYQKALEVDSTLVYPREKLGLALLRSGRIDEAEDTFLKTLELDSTSSLAWVNLGIIYADKGLYHRAVEYFQKGLVFNTENAAVHYFLGLCQYHLQNYDDAQKALKMALKYNPEDEDAHILLGQIYQEKNDLKQAIQHYTEALKINDQNYSVHTDLGKLYFQMGKTDRAIGHYQKSLELNPNQYQIQDHLGVIYMGRGDLEKAKKAFREALLINPQDALAESCLRQLSPNVREFEKLLASLKAEPVELFPQDVKELVQQAPSRDACPDLEAIILLDKKSVAIEKDGTSRYTVHKIVKLLTEKGIEEYGEVYIPFNSDNEIATVNLAHTIQEDGSMVEVSPEAISKITPPELSAYNLYSDVKYLVFSMPALEPGSVIEYQVTVKDNAPIVREFWSDSFLLQNQDSTLITQYALKLPETDELIVRYHNISLTPEVKTQDGYKLYLWQAQNLAPISFNANMPPLRDVAAGLYLTTVPSWEALDRWYSKLYQRNEIVTEPIKKLAQELTADAKTLDDKIKVLFYYVEKNIRYVGLEFGLGAYEPHRAEEVLKNKYGDCKDQTVLLTSLLKAVGIPAYPALVRPQSEGTVDDQFPAVGQFSHVIVYVPLEIKDVWLDPTGEVCKYGLLPVEDQGQLVFVIDGKGGQLKKTSTFGEDVNRFQVHLKIWANSDGSARMEEQITAQGVFSDHLKAGYKFLTPKKLRESIENYLEESYGKATLLDYEVAGLKDFDRPFQRRIALEQAQFFTTYFTGALSINLSAQFIHATLGLEAPEKRRHDLLLKSRIGYQKSFEFILPAGYILERLPQDFHAESEWADIDASYLRRDTSFVISYDFKLKKSFIPLSQYREFYDFVQKSVARTEEELIFKPGAEVNELEILQKLITKYPNDPKAYLSLANVYFQKNFLDKAQEAIQKALQINPNFAEAYALWGSIYYSLNQFEQAIEAFKKAIQLKPDLAQAHWELARVYTHIGQHAEAAIVLEKAIEKIPDDIDLRTLLYGVYNDLGETTKALEVMQALIAINPNQASFYVSLAYSYDRLGQYEQAVTHLKKALELNPNSATAYNNLAWVYAEMGKNLDEAITLARKALDLEPANAGFLDTLAEVYYKKQQYDQAIEAINKAIELEPNREYFRNQLRKFEEAKNKSGKKKDGRKK